MKYFRTHFIFNLSLSRKIIGAFLAVSLLVGLSSIFSYRFFKQIDSSFTELLGRNTAVLEQVSGIQTETQLQNSLLFSYLTEPSKEKEQRLLETNAALSAKIGETMKLTGAGEDNPEFKTLAEANDTFARLLKKITDYMNRNEPGLAKTEALLWAVPLTETLTTTAEKIQGNEKKSMALSMENNRRLVDGTVRNLIYVSLGALVAAVMIGLFLSRMIVRPMRIMVQAAGRIAACDLSAEDIRVKSGDEIGELGNAFNRMKENLHEIISQVGQSTRKVAEAAEELSGNSKQMSAATVQISSVVEGISAGADSQVNSVNAGVGLIEGMEAAMSSIVQVARSADGKSAQAKEAAAAGSEAIVSAVRQMNAIQEKIRQLAASVDRLGSRSSQIVEANDAIAGIAKRTNMLALNAAIEATRAGESGKGFAVVAEEIRKLSQQTADAAVVINELVGSIRSETAEVVRSTEVGAQEVGMGIRVVNQAGEAFGHIESAVDDVARQIALVSEQSLQVAQQSAEAVQTVRVIDEVAVRTASGTGIVSAQVQEQYASMEEIVSYTNLLSAMAEDLQGMVGKFQLKSF